MMLAAATSDLLGPKSVGYLPDRLCQRLFVIGPVQRAPHPVDEELGDENHAPRAHGIRPVKAVGETEERLAAGSDGCPVDDDRREVRSVTDGVDVRDGSAKASRCRPLGAATGQLPGTQFELRCVAHISRDDLPVQPPTRDEHPEPQPHGGVRRLRPAPPAGAGRGP
jgi:hypothetical protein